MDVLNAFIKDVYFSPVVLQGCLLVICSLHKFISMCFGARHQQSNLWDIGVWLVLFVNPFLALAASHFWFIWLQTLFLSVPLLFAGITFVEKVLKKRYNEAILAHMFGIYLFIAGQITSLLIYVAIQLFEP